MALIDRDKLKERGLALLANPHISRILSNPRVGRLVMRAWQLRGTVLGLLKPGDAPADSADNGASEAASSPA